MTPERRRELECGPDPQKLTDEEIRQGYHFCPDWDFMVVGPEDSEISGCTCQKVTSYLTIKSGPLSGHTKVTFGGQEIKGISEITIHIVGPNEPVQATLRFDMVSLECGVNDYKLLVPGAKDVEPGD